MKKRIIFPSSFLIAAFYIPLYTILGFLLGYLLANLFCYKYIHSGKISPIYLNIKDWQIHIHHWIMGLFLLFFLFTLNYNIPQILFGFAFGILFHDLYTDKEWYRVIYRKNE